MVDLILFCLVFVGAVTAGMFFNEANHTWREHKPTSIFCSGIGLFWTVFALVVAYAWKR